MTKGYEDILYVQMFGGFSMTWHGVQVGGGAKSRESQFSYLMQMLLHHRQEGVKREQLEAVLFEDREIGNTYHALQCVIYNAKRKLKAAGLPEVNYIEQHKGIFKWTGKIPVTEDAAEFERLYQEAEEAEDAKEKLGLYLEACYCYTGEFLSYQAGMIWAVREARRYRGIFCSCVEYATGLLRETKDFLQMEKLGLYASRIQPLSDWETVTMEALVSMGHSEEAIRLYDDTAEFYLQEQGLKPSGKLMELLEKLGSRFNHGYEALDNIQDGLSEDGEHLGGYLCTYPIFQGIYHMVQRMMERGGQSVFLMLCTVVDGKGNPLEEGPLLDELSGRLEKAICHSVRHGDAVNQYGRGQYLVLLVNTTRENCEVVKRRINKRFTVGRQRIRIQYYVNNVTCMPE